MRLEASAVRLNDLEANRVLTGICWRLEDFVASNRAIEWAAGDAPSNAARAELYTARGSNSKRRWKRH